MSLKAAIEDGLAVEDELEQEKFSGLKFFHAYAKKKTQQAASFQQRTRMKEPGFKLLSMGVAKEDSPFRAARTHQVPDFTVAHDMIKGVARSNGDIRRKAQSAFLKKQNRDDDDEEEDEDKLTTVKLPPLHDESKDSIPLLSEQLRQAMHYARVWNSKKQDENVQSALLPVECYDLEDVDAETLLLMKQQLKRSQDSMDHSAYKSPESQNGHPFQSAKATAKAYASAGNTSSIKNVDHASMSATCHWCRERRKWCGWCKVPAKDNSSSALSFLGIGGKSVSRQNVTHNRRAGDSKGTNAKHRRKIRSVSSLGRLEGQMEITGRDDIVERAAEEARKEKLERQRQQAKEELRKNVFAMLMEKRPISFGLFDEEDLRQLSYRVRVREFRTGQIVIKYAEDCIPAIVARPDTADGQPLIGMGSSFFIVMHGILDIFTEYSAKGEPVHQGKLTRGSVLGELSAILGVKRNCTVRAAMSAGVIEVDRSDLVLLLSKKLSEIAEAAELERNRPYLALAEKQRLENEKIKRERAEAASASRRASIEALLIPKVEKSVFRKVLNEFAREREWAAGKYARVLQKELEQKRKGAYVRKIQSAARKMIARIKAERQADVVAYRRKCTQLIQRTFRGHLARVSMSKMRSKQGFDPIDFQSVNNRRHAEKALCYYNEKVERQTNLILKANEHCIEELFQLLRKNFIQQRLGQLKALVKGIKDGTVFGFSFLTISEHIRVPIKALNRWIRDENIIKKQRENETDEQFAVRLEKMMKAIHEKVLQWYDNTSLVQSLVKSWTDDIHLPFTNVSMPDGQSKGTMLAQQIPNFGNMKKLRDIFNAAKLLKALSTKKDRSSLDYTDLDTGTGQVQDFCSTDSKDFRPRTGEGSLTPVHEGMPSTFPSITGDILEPNRGDIAISETAFDKKADSFSLADYINQSIDSQEDMHLPEVSFSVEKSDTSELLGNIIEPANHPCAKERVRLGLGDEDNDETDDMKALKMQSANEASRRVESRKRLLLEYAHKIELNAMNKGLDVRLLFTNLDTNSDERLNKSDLKKGFCALQIKIDERSLDELVVALGRDRMGQFPLKNLLDEIWLPPVDFGNKDKGSFSSHDNGLLARAGERHINTDMQKNYCQKHRPCSPSLCFGGRDGQSGALEQEAEDIHNVQNAMVLLYAVINPDSAENKKVEASVEEVLATLQSLASKGKRGRRKALKKMASRKVKKKRLPKVSEEAVELFKCKRGCGFKGEFSTVELHEENCTYVRGNIVDATGDLTEIKHPFRDRLRTCVLHEIIPYIPAPSENDLNPFRSNVRMACLMRTLYDGLWEDFLVCILDWDKPILSKEFIEIKCAHIDRLEEHLTSIDVDEAAKAIKKLYKDLGKYSVLREVKGREDVAYSDAQLDPQHESLVLRVKALIHDEELLSHSTTSDDQGATLQPRRLNGSEGIEYWAQYNMLYKEIALLRIHTSNLLLDLLRANTLDSDKGQVYRRQLHESASMLRTLKDFAFDISGIYRSREISAFVSGGDAGGR